MKQLITKILLLSSLLTLGACSAESNQKTSNTDSTVSSSVKEIAEKKKQAQLEAKKKLEEQKAKEEAERKQQEEKRKAEEQKQANIAQKTASAETILAQAESNPTRDNYNSALSAIRAIPGGNQSLSDRLASVDSTIKANEAAQAEAARVAEQQRQQAIAQEQAAAQAQQQNNSYTVAGQWFIAANGMVFVRSDSGKYYSRVTNPNNYQYMSQIDADKAGYSRASRGNQYARP